jgi:uncharacterized protein YbjT (DUF2867 family)
MYAVLGATGNTGSATVAALLARNVAVRAIMRDAARGAELKARGVEVVEADVSDADALARALNGIDGAYVLIPPPSAGSDFFGAAARAASGIAQAAKSAGAPHLVALSSIGAHLSKGSGAIRSLRIFEDELAATGLNQTVLRPGYFMQNWANLIPLAQADGILPSMLQPLDQPAEMVSTEDIGAVAAEMLVQPVTGRRVVHLSGPRPYTPRDVAAALSRLLGRPVEAVAPPPSEWEQIIVNAGLDRSYAAALVEMYHGLNDQSVGGEPGAEARRAPTSLDDALARRV